MEKGPDFSIISRERPFENEPDIWRKISLHSVVSRPARLSAGPSRLIALGPFIIPTLYPIKVSSPFPRYWKQCLWLTISPTPTIRRKRSGLYITFFWFEGKRDPVANETDQMLLGPSSMASLDLNIGTALYYLILSVLTSTLITTSTCFITKTLLTAVIYSSRGTVNIDLSVYLSSGP